VFVVGLSSQPINEEHGVVTWVREFRVSAGSWQIFKNGEGIEMNQTTHHIGLKLCQGGISQQKRLRC